MTKDLHGQRKEDQERERERGSVLIKNNKQRRRDIVNEDENRIPDSILSAIDGQTVVTNMPEDEETAKTKPINQSISSEQFDTYANENRWTMHFFHNRSAREIFAQMNQCADDQIQQGVPLLLIIGEFRSFSIDHSQ